LRLEELRQADDLRPSLGCLAHLRNGTLKVFFRFRAARHLYKSGLKLILCHGTASAASKLSPLA
jgi:hypothetical protein